MLTEEIKNLIDDLYNVTPNYVGVGYGHKVTNGEMTGDHAIIFFVPQKKPLYIIPENEVLPSEEIVLGDLILKMDVVEIGEVTAFACDPSCYSWQTVPPANRQYIRPMQGGISLTSQNQLGTVGTLGFIAVDTETQALVGVTNNHVVIKDAFYTSQRDPLGPITNEYDITDGGARNPDTAYQPGETNSPPLNYKVGEVVRYVPIYLSGGVNKVDGALISVECSPVINIAESFKQFGLSYNSPYQFATTAMIGLICILLPIFIYTIWFIYIQINNLNVGPELTKNNSSFNTDTFTMKISAIILLMLLVTGIAIFIASLSNIRRELNRLIS